MIDQILISIIIVFTLFFFILGKWRHDVVALISLFSAVFLGLIPYDEIFNGFIHPIVILIIAMLIISKALISSGAIDIIARYIKFNNLNPILQLGLITLFTAIISAFINSMGALAFMIPIAMKVSKQTKTPLSVFLMPIAFASHFGGGATLIGSVSNVIISGFRAEKIDAFGFFDFALVAVPISLISILFIVTIGWRIIPKRDSFLNKETTFKSYIAELKILPNSPIIGKTIEEFLSFSKEDFSVINIVRDKKDIIEPSIHIVLQEGDILVLETDTSTLESIIVNAKLEILQKEQDLEIEKDNSNFQDTEFIIPRNSFFIGKTIKKLDLYYSYKVNVLAICRSGESRKEESRMRDISLREGDVIIVRGHKDNLSRFIKRFSLLSLKERDFNFEGNKKKSIIVLSIFIISVILSSLNFIPIHLIFITASIIIIATGIIPSKEIYSFIDFPMIVMIAVMIHLGLVFYETGTASSLVNAIFSLFSTITPQTALFIILILSILLSDIMSNVAVAILLGPIAFSLALKLGVSPDPFLIAVAIGSGSSYLTPIGHQSNIFVMNIGNYKFTDYWKLGLPLEIITLFVGYPLILYFWPF